jgi:hypothetical protein
MGVNFEICEGFNGETDFYETIIKNTLKQTIYPWTDNYYMHDFSSTYLTITFVPLGTSGLI